MSSNFRSLTFGELTGEYVGGWVKVQGESNLLVGIRHTIDRTEIQLGTGKSITYEHHDPCGVLSPKQHFEEPFDPAIRIVGEDGSIWARVCGEWVSPGLSECDWDELVAEYGPLTLHNLGEQA